jgi:hypothetical protein
MGRAIPCLIRIVAVCPRPRLLRVCASHNKTFPAHEAFILSNRVDESHVPRTAPGTPEANGRSPEPRARLWPPRPAGEADVLPGQDVTLSRQAVPSSCPAGQDVTRGRAGQGVRLPGTAACRLPAMRAISPGLSEPSRRVAGSPDKQTHRWPLDGQSAPPGQRCDPADPAVTKAGPIRADTAALAVTRHNAVRGGNPWPPQRR